MSLQNIFQDIPHNSLFAINQFSGRLYSFYNTSFNEFTNDKWLEKFSSQILG